MLKVIGSNQCPDTMAALKQLEEAGTPFEFVNILENHDNLKVYLKLREESPVYAEVRGTARLGIPAFVREDGSVTLDMSEI